jgi:hypothetical protein
VASDSAKTKISIAANSSQDAATPSVRPSGYPVAEFRITLVISSTMPWVI